MKIVQTIISNWNTMFIALNLINDIVTQKLMVEKAREIYCEIASAYMMNIQAPYTEKLHFKRHNRHR